LKQFDDTVEQEGEHLPRSQPVLVARSMLEVAVSLGKEMSRP
jgi:hypothetical protein